MSKYLKLAVLAGIGGACFYAYKNKYITSMNDITSHVSKHKYKYLLGLIPVGLGLVFLKFLHGISKNIPFNKSPKAVTLLKTDYYYKFYDAKPVILITGANGGIGKEASKILSSTNANVVMACRNVTRSKPVLLEIMKETGNNNVELMTLDLGDFNSIDTFMDAFKAKYKRLDIIVCNAAVWPQKKGQKTKQGLEMAFGVNHIGHMKLVLGLKDLMTSTIKNFGVKNTKIVIVTAIPYTMDKYNKEFDINGLNKHELADAYFQSKMCNVMFTRQFAKLYPLNSDGTGILCVSLHPGVGRTNLLDDRDENGNPVNKYGVLRGIIFFIWADTVPQLAYTQCYLALANPSELKHGGHYINKDIQNVYGGVCDNDNICKQLWDKSLSIINQ